MNDFKNIFTLLTVCSILAISYCLSITGFGVDISEKMMNIFVMVFDLSFIISAILIIIESWRNDAKKWIILMTIPLLFFLIAILLSLYDIQFHDGLLIIFDLYVLLVYTHYISENWLSRPNRSQN